MSKKLLNISARVEASKLRTYECGAATVLFVNIVEPTGASGILEKIIFYSNKNIF